MSKQDNIPEGWTVDRHTEDGTPIIRPAGLLKPTEYAAAAKVSRRTLANWKLSGNGQKPVVSTDRADWYPHPEQDEPGP